MSITRLLLFIVRNLSSVPSQHDMLALSAAPGRCGEPPLLLPRPVKDPSASPAPATLTLAARLPLFRSAGPPYKRRGASGEVAAGMKERVKPDDPIV